ncbi:MAG TPA: potassium channel family protein [Thermoanaerobaculia bacterium]
MSTDALATPAASAPAQPARSAMPVYQLFMLALCVLALTGVVAQNAVDHDSQIEGVLMYADTAICIAFGIDFLITLWRAPNRMKYFFTWGWLDLLSSIPMLDVARWGRIARSARIARLLRGLRAARVLSTAILSRRKQSTLLAATLLAVVLVFAGATAVLHFEDPNTGNIKTAEDAIWWAITTITTVGYGDKFPMTTAGRMVAALLMTAGVGLFGVVSAGLATWFLSPDQKAETNSNNELREEIAALRRAIEQLQRN